MTNITAAFENIYLPQKALVVYSSVGNAREVYVEAYDMDDNGKPVNAHPLNIGEIAALAEQLNTSADLSNDFLTSKGLLPANVLYISPHNKGYAIWHTPSQKTKLFFKKDLSIPCGETFIPAMLWLATKNDLHVFALKTDKKPDIKTPLYYAPYFNIHESGLVCMGTVNINIDRKCSLEEFMGSWEQYFFNSYFSHLIEEQSPVNGNIVQLWQGLVGTGKKFPSEVLVKKGVTIKNLIV